MIVRELITRLGISFDEKGADDADKRIAKLSTGMSALGTLAAGFSVYRAFGFLKDMAMAASNAEQTLAKLNAVFGARETQGIVAWAKGFKDATGESQLAMREMAATMGGMLVPMLNGNREQAAKWSKDLAAIAVDVGALENMTPDEVMNRFFSAMTGETEAIERLGVSIKEASLQQFMLQQGMKGTVKQLTLQQKMELIYKKIMHDKSHATGAAAKESKTLAGAMRRLSGSMKDMMAGGGNQIMSWAIKLVDGMNKGVNVIEGIITKTTILRSVILAASAALVAWGISWTLANLPLLIMAVGIGVLMVALDDLLGFFSGKKSAFGDFFKELNDGLDMLMFRVKFIRDTVQSLRDIVKGSWLERAMVGGAAQESTNTRTSAKIERLRRRNLTPEEQAKLRDEDKRKAREALGLSNPAADLGIQVPTGPSAFKSHIPIPSATTPTPAVKGDVNLTINGDPKRETIDRGEAAARRILQEQRRSRFHTTTVK